MDNFRVKEREWVKKLPKIDLHCHLDGSLNLNVVRSYLTDKGIPFDEEWLNNKLMVRDDCRNLTEYLEKFDLPLEILQEDERLETAAYCLLKDAAGENVKYIETRFAPLLLNRRGLSCETAIESVLRGIRRGEKDFSICANVIVCAMRHFEEEENRKTFKAAAEYLGKGVCAVDLAGDESKYENTRFQNLFSYARDLGLPFTIHSGECQSLQNVKSALDFGAKRIGHGIAMRGDKETQIKCREQKTGIELCPISNFQTKAIASIEEYPYREFLENGVYVTVNTDNRTVSNTTITRELEFLAEHFDMTEKEAVSLMRNAAEASFASLKTRKSLLNLYSNY